MAFLSLITILLNLFSRINCDKTIYWSENYKLRYDDFRKKSPDNSINNGWSVTGLNCSYSYNIDSINFEIISYFIKDESWLKLKDSLTLNHEQRHFDIAELNSRMLNQKISNLFKNDINKLKLGNHIDSLINLCQNTCINDHDLYDNSVNDSLNNAGQILWNKKIDSCLISSRPFMSKKLVFYFKN